MSTSNPVIQSNAFVDRRVHLANWTALRYFNLYRLVIAGLFSVLSSMGKMPPNLSALDARLLTFTAISYALLTIAAQLAIEQRLLRYRLLVHLLTLLDIVAISLLMHAAGGVPSGLGMLTVVAVAGTCLLASGRAGVFFAALATLAFLGETLFGTIYLGYPQAYYTQAGLLGAACFGTAVLATLLAERARSGEALAAKRAIDIENLSLLNEHIVRRMRAGIMALDQRGEVILMNDAAREILGVDDLQPGALQHMSPALERLYDEWLTIGENPETTITGRGNISALVSFTELAQRGQEAAGTLVFLEDAAETRQRAQQLKLASLGRLTASIAHEIRNPLGAISHASQLLSESPELAEQDQRLTDIVLQHAGRVNTIIENILNLGRRRDAVAESFALRPWVDDFVAELKQRYQLSPEAIKIVWMQPEITVRMDKSQLQQVFWNLCENALRYAEENPRIEFTFDVNQDNGRPFADIRDSGPGLQDGVAERLFEPFVTSESEGTGLGLYIARELCESNQASLQLLSHNNGCRFRITFAHPERQQRTGEI